MSYKLSEECFRTIMAGGDFSEPIVQVLSLKKMTTSSGQDRFRVCLSDGKYMITVAMVTASVLSKVGEKGVPKFSVIQLTRYTTTVINNTPSKGDSRVLLMLDIKLIADGDDVHEIIGNPISYSEAITQEQRHEPPPAKIPKISGPSKGAESFDGNKSLVGHIVHPISSLNPYNNKWIIKARVMNKTPIKTWSNSKGEGKLFSMDLIDESGEIRLTGFRDLVDKFYDKVEIDKVYYISKCMLKPANKQFSNLKNDYEMTMVNETVIEECQDDDMGAVPQINYNFVPVKQIMELDPKSIIDIIGVVKGVGDLQVFQARSTGREVKKKEVMLVDQSNASVTLTLWGAEAENFDGSNNPVVVLKGARISEFGGGKTLSTVSGTIMKLNPDLKESYRLKQWYDTEGNSVEATNVSARSGGSLGFNTPWMCFKEMNVGDWSGNQWVSMFSSEAEKVLGVTAQEAGDLFEQDPSQFNELVEKAHFKQFVLKCRAKTEVYNDEQRLKTVAVKVDPINYEEYNNHLINRIKQLTGA
ncbi:replication protein A 70 isoform X2 [Rhynchophorus ferrugineus]|uniref:replication protein A 70 isoform X2 n=1 Tax=Rhynchophorus ferrugineus TaxID=354439 RepID=UPI003FCC50DE